MTYRRGSILLAILALMAAVGWWATRASDPPTVLGERTAGAGLEFEPDRKGEPVFIELASRAPSADDETITFTSASAHVTENSANAVVSIAICVRAPGATVVGASFLDKMSDSCSEVRQIAEGTELAWGTGRDQPDEYLIMLFSPATKGAVTVDRIDYEYRRDEAHGGAAGKDSARVEYRYVVS